MLTSIIINLELWTDGNSFLFFLFPLTIRSTECSNLCNLPNGYNSKCEQKFSQKRLLTLDGDGQSLYVDTYWFPSCCVCTLATNN